MEIQYSDLFSSSIPNEIDDLIAKIREVGTAMDAMVREVQTKAQGLNEALAGASSATKGGRDTTSAQAAQAEALYQQYQQIKEITKYLADNMAGLTKAQQDNQRVVKLLMTANDSLSSSFEKMRAEAELAKIALENLNVSGRGSDAEIKALSATVKTLEGQMKNMEKALLSSASAHKANGTSAAAHKQQLIGLDEAYATLAPLISQTGVNLNELIVTQKQQQSVSKNGEAANSSLAGSYNQLYAQYNLIKTALNAMTAEMRNSEKVGKVWEAEALRLMNIMKGMQEATGKHVLSVGDYGKALNGLSISTQQVLREMPTLANSLQQFFIAISNNVPIFVDNFKRAQEELGGFTKALSATIKVIFSWNTILLVILTVLPKIAQAISNKRKAQEEANKTNQEAYRYESLLAQAERERTQQITNETNKLKFLSEAALDNARSWDERIKAAEIMKKEWAAEFANLSAEQIALGEATIVTQKLTEALVAQAEARAFLNEIGNLSLKLYDLDIKKQKERAIIDEETVKRTSKMTELDILRSDVLKRIREGEDARKMSEDAAAIQKLELEISSSSKAIEQATKNWDSYDESSRDVIKTIDDLKERIKVSGLDIADASTENLGGAANKLPDYFTEAVQAYIESMEEGFDKEMVVLDFEYTEQRKKRQEQFESLKGMLETANAEERAIILEQMRWLSGVMIQEEANYNSTREKMWQEHLDTYREEVTETAEDMIAPIRTQLQAEKQLRDSAAYQRYEQNIKNGESEIQSKTKLNAELLASEKSYWESYLQQLREEGLLTVEEYNRIMSNLSHGETATSGGRKRRGRAAYSSITELAFSFTSLPKEAEEKGLSQQYQDYVSAINSGLETSIDYMNEWMDTRIAMAELAVEMAEKEADAAKSNLDYELEARANGYANNVALAQQEYEEKKKIQKEAAEEQARLEKVQEAINTAQQISSLITATANIWAAYAAIPFAGPGLAAAVTALMWSSFLASKITAAQYARKSVEYGEGMGEYLNYGGSHASGNDIDFGRDRKGRQRRVEKGEVIGVINKKNVKKYGADNVLDIIRSLNNGTFEQHYSPERAVLADELVSSVLGGAQYADAQKWAILSRLGALSDKGGATSPLNAETLAYGLKNANIEAKYEMAFSGLSEMLGGTDVSSLERDVAAIRRQGDTERYVDRNGNVVERYRNLTRIIKN